MTVRTSFLFVSLLAGCSAAPAEDGGPEVEGAAGQALKVPVAKIVSAGGTHTCAKIGGQGVKCWGWNAYGQIGNGVDGGEYPIPQSIVDPGANVKDIVASDISTCALLKEGEVKCWGANFTGMLGTGDTTNTNAPGVAVPLPAPAREVSARGLHTCARVEGGAVYCWGSNANGELGIGTSGPTQPLPTSPVDLGGRKAVGLAAGADFVCTLLGNGTVRCWGANYGGQLGDGGTEASTVPKPPIALGAKAVAISAGNAHACALLETGEMKCWGNNFDGQVGLGAISFVPEPPQTVVGLPGPVASIAVGGDHTCAVLVDGRGACWGFNPLGQVGAPDWEWQHPTPVVLDIEFPVASMSSGFDHTCALSTTGTVKCWGANYGGKLGISCYPGCTDTVGLSPSQIENVQF